MKKRLLTLILIVLIFMCTMPLTGFSESPHAHDDITFVKWESTDSLPSKAGNYYLDQDVTLTDTWKAPSGTTNLCLNGKTIDEKNGYIFVGDGVTFNLYDCGDSGTIKNGTYGILIDDTGNTTINGGTITNCYYGIAGAYWPTNLTINDGTITNNKSNGVYTFGNFTFNGGTISNNTDCGVWLYGWFTMNGGTISNNAALEQGQGGGVYINGGGFAMNGGSISNNTAKEGGGVYVSGGWITMTGNAKITGNSATMGNAGGIYLNPETALNMAGGEISNNTATAMSSDLCGVYAKNCTVKLGGTAKITGNSTYDLMLLDGTTVTIDEENSPASGMSVGIKMRSGNEGIFTSNTGYGCKDYFTSNDSNFGVFYENDENKLTLLGNQSNEKTVSFDSDGGSKVLFQTVTVGNKATKPEDPTKDGYEFVAWVDANDKPFEFNTPITKDITIKATWEKISGSTDYKIIEGAKSTWVITNDENPKFRSDADYDKFSHVLLDGERLAEKYFDVTSGSTIVTLKPEYVATLKLGKHTIEIVSNDGSAKTVFYIEEKLAKTDGEDIVLPEATISSTFIAGSFVALTGIFFTLKKKRVR